ncbi:MAG: hypothetical protein EOP49_35685 [Sphingobacteriales bacterium]|nr:MAG: hypothetical protein EOP49_35685 [Sphingobacteriales bacterium]
MKKIISIGSCTILLLTLFTACRKGGPIHRPNEKIPADVATAWMKLHMRLTMTTPGFNSVVSSRSVGYAGLTLYESVVPGFKEYHSIATQLNNGYALKLMLPPANGSIYAPASANAAMAQITKSLFGNTSSANLKTIDSLDAALTAGFLPRVSADVLEASEKFGQKVANAIFEWSKSDGGHEGYLRVTDPTYVAPTGAAFWIPTPPGFGPPVHPRWGSNRSFIPGVPANTMAPAPIAYSPVSGSVSSTSVMSAQYPMSKKPGRPTILSSNC